jgi:carbonic anhydrase
VGGSSGAAGRWSRFETVSALLPVNCRDDILPAHRTTPVAGVLAYNNLHAPHRRYGWERREAERHFDQFSAVFEIRDPVEFVLSEAQRLRERYPRVMVAPLFYQVGEGLLYQITERAGC